MGINSVRLTSLIPLESRFLSLISVYFFLSMLYTFIAFVWFILVEYFRARKYLPNCILKATGSYLLVFKKMKKNKIESEVASDSASTNIEDNIRVLNTSMFFFSLVRHAFILFNRLVFNIRLNSFLFGAIFTNSHCRKYNPIHWVS